MTELLPCPHHEEAIYPKRIAQHYPYPTQYGKEHWIVSYECPECGCGYFERSKTEQEADEAAARDWNTRHERTCRPIWKQSKQQGRLTDTCECSECCGCLDDLGVGIDGGVFPYCPYCGAKVVDS